MNKFLEYSKKFCLKELSVIFFISLILYVIFYAKYDVYLIDVGREAYIPWQMLKGEVLYKDIFNVYGPLGYQINSIAYILLGVHLDTLYLMGFLNSLVILFSTFYIAKIFVDKKTSLCIPLLTLFVCVYAKNFFNFIFVYSYCAVYALSGFLLSLLSILYYLKDKRIGYLFLSFFFAGFAFANKVEYLPYFIFLFLCLPFWLKKDWKKYLIAFVAFMLMPVISFGALFIQGMNVGDLLNAFGFVKKLVESPFVTNFYYNYGLYFNPSKLGYVFLTLGKVLKYLVPFVLFFYVLNYWTLKLKKWKLIKLFVTTVMAMVVFLFTFCKLEIMQVYYDDLFDWLGVAVLAIIAISVSVLGYKFVKNKFNFEIINDNDKTFLFLAVASVLVSMKGLFALSLTCYGTFNFAALILPLVIFSVNYIPCLSKYVDKNAWVKTVHNIAILVMVVFLMLTFHRLAQSNLSLVSKQNGMIYIKRLYANQNELIEYIKQNTSKEDKIVTVPEGAIINFLAQRDTDNFYYYLIPVNVDIFGQNKILNDFKANPPEYFLMNSLFYVCYNTDGFCSYAPNICEFIKQNYTSVYYAKGAFDFNLLKRNDLLE